MLVAVKKKKPIWVVALDVRRTLPNLLGALRKKAQVKCYIFAGHIPFQRHQSRFQLLVVGFV